MDRQEAERLVNEIRDIPSPTEEEIFLYTDALNYLIEKTGKPEWMMELGGYYYEEKRFDLALKYYEMAAAKNDTSAFCCLGYIWYYGRTGQKDYKKAFECFSKAMNRGDTVAAYKVADMYKNGYAVEKDYERYKMIIERLYIRLKRDNFRRGPVSDVLTRYARIRADEGKIDEAVSTYKTAKAYLAGRLEWNGFFGDRNVMKWMIGDMYKITKPDMDNLDLYDLYYLLTKPWKGYIVTTDEKIAIESVIEGEACVIRYGDKWFRDTDDFFARAEIYGERITAHYYDISVYEDADR